MEQNQPVTFAHHGKNEGGKTQVFYALQPCDTSENGKEVPSLGYHPKQPQKKYKLPTIDSTVATVKITDVVICLTKNIL